MFRTPRLLALLWLALFAWSEADHVIISAGPALRRWEDLRTPRDQHDRFWGNFIRAATLRMDEIRQAYSADAPIVWMVFRPGYVTRGKEDREPYTTWISQVAAKRRVKLLWFDTADGFIRLMNSRPPRSIQTFDYFGHSNRFCFMFDYANELPGASIEWLHEKDLHKLKGGVFARNAYCRSWGCHTGESMSAVWRKTLGVPLEGAKGYTDYRAISYGRLPDLVGSWVR